jgi:septum formation protein
MTHRDSREYPSISKEYPLILASASPRRKRLLQQLDLPFNSLPCDINEEEAGSDPFDRTLMLSEKKAMAAYSKSAGNWILGADTIVLLDNIVLGKPIDNDEAASMLTILSGREHEVLTGFSIINPAGETVHRECVRSNVTIKDLSNQEIAAYIETGEPFGKAGSYAIQGVGAFMVKNIVGSYSNVVGLPIYSLIKSLLTLGALNNFPIK